jgi:hypothetical protein
MFVAIHLSLVVDARNFLNKKIALGRTGGLGLFIFDEFLDKEILCVLKKLNDEYL